MFVVDFKIADVMLKSAVNFHKNCLQTSSMKFLKAINDLLKSLVPYPENTLPRFHLSFYLLCLVVLAICVRHHSFGTAENHCSTFFLTVFHRES